MEKEKYIVCPICRGGLKRCNSSLKCEGGHSYDLAKSGYVNLLNPGKKNNAKAGDSKEMIRARTLFFQTGCYEGIKNALCDIASSLSPSVIIDAGCGEGYYTNSLAMTINNALVFGFDMSKFGTEHASKQARAKGLKSTLFSVSNIFDMPLENECADLVVNMFAPVAIDEFRRTLRTGGHLIIGVAGVHHLEGLKRAIYDEVYLNEKFNDTYEGFVPVSVKSVKYSTTVNSSEAIWALFQMTPYFHRTSIADKEKLLGLTSLTTEVEVDFYIFKKI